MASGHVNRAQRPNTWPHRPAMRNVKFFLANWEPSTHEGQECRAIDVNGSLAKAWEDMTAAGVKRIQSSDLAI